MSEIVSRKTKERAVDDVVVCALIRTTARGMAHNAQLAEYQRLAEFLDRVLAEPRVTSRYRVYWFELLRERRKCYHALGRAPPGQTIDEQIMRLACHRDTCRRAYAIRKFQKSMGPAPQLSSPGPSSTAETLPPQLPSTA